MPLFISINIGFVTNSSSAINHFPRQLLEHPKVAAFMAQMGIEGGFVGNELWNRGDCSTVAVTLEQKKEVVRKLEGINDGSQPGDNYYIRPPEVDTIGDSVLIIYGDEYESIAASLSCLMAECAKEMGLTFDSDEFN